MNEPYATQAALSSTANSTGSGTGAGAEVVGAFAGVTSDQCRPASLLRNTCMRVAAHMIESEVMRMERSSSGASTGTGLGATEAATRAGEGEGNAGVGATLATGALEHPA